MHRLVLDDDETDGDVADDAGDENADVQKRQGDQERQADVLWTQNLKIKI